MKQHFLAFGLFGVLALFSSASGAGDTLEKRAETLKKQAVDLNRDLFKLEEELLYPANTQIVVFLAVNTKVPFALDSIELKLNGNLATTYLYSEREVNALNRGGVQRVFMGNLPSGPHKIEAVFNGRGDDDRYFRRQVAYQFEKKNDPKFVELVVQQPSKGQQPDFLIREFK